MATLGRPKAKSSTHFGRPGGMCGAAGGTFGGLEELVKLVKLGIGQKVLGIWNWAFDKNYKPNSTRTAPRLGPGAAD